MTARWMPAPDPVVPALQVALAYDITAYDACYAALARQLQIPLITADGALVRKLTGSKIPIQTLEELQD